MLGLKQRNSFYLNTSYTLALWLFGYTLLAALLVFHFILSPMANRAADDLGGLMHILSKSWSSLPASKKQAFQSHLREQHQLFIRDQAIEVQQIPHTYPFLPRLEKALHYHTGQNITVNQSVDGKLCFWVNIPHAEQSIKIGFYHERLGPDPVKAVIGIAIAAFVLIVITTTLAGRRIARPIKTLSDAVNQLGSGKLSTRIPEKGSDELIMLAKNFNAMATEIAQLISNRTLLFGGISHDLKTPITRMLIALELVENENNTQLISNMRQNLLEMKTTIEQTLDLIKGLDKQHAVVVSIDHVLDSLIADYQNQGLIIHCAEHHCGLYLIDLNAFRRVLCNLLDNAFRYSDKQAVTLSCKLENQRMIFSLTDQGPGIPNDKLNAVFQPFYRLENSRNKQTGGSGLGLAIVKQLCDIYHWEIELGPAKPSGLIVKLCIPAIS